MLNRWLCPGLVVICALSLAGCEGIVGALLPNKMKGVDEVDEPYVCNDPTYGTTALARRLTPDEYQNAIRDVLGIEDSPDYPRPYDDSVSGYSTEPAMNGIGEQVAEDVMLAAENLAVALEARVPVLLACASTGDEACAATFLATYGRRLFRRALDAAERDELLAIYRAERADAATFSEAVAVMSFALLQMPAFVFVVEAPAPEGTDQLRTDLELATRLALLLWSSVPDDTLLTAAEAGELHDRGAVLAQAQRMLADPRGDRARIRFVRELTKTPYLARGDKDLSLFPYLDNGMIDSINASFDRFITTHMRSGDIGSLLTSNKATVDANMAWFFELPEVAGWTDVELPADRYSGILTQPALLAALAHPNESSYVYRGVMLRKRLLCNTFDAPPANAGSEFATLELPQDPTGREKSERVRAHGTCGGCHNYIDPGGLALEHFDAVGRYRETYDTGRSIEIADSLAGVEGGVVEFDGPVELGRKLVELESLRQCFARQMFRFTVSRLDEEPSDICTVQRLDDALVASGGRLDDLLLNATQIDGFLYRRGDAP